MTVQDGFEEWVRARSPVLLRAAFLLTGDQHAAEDLVQTALERVGAAWSRIDGHPDAYARRVMYRAHARWWARRGSRESAVEVVPDGHLPDHAGAAERRVMVQTALTRLTPSQRAVLVLRYFEDLSEAEAASVLGCSVGAVKSQSHKALAALRRAAPELVALVRT